MARTCRGRTPIRAMGEPTSRFYTAARLTFRLSAPQKQEIVKTLKLRKRVSMVWVLRHIEQAGVRYMHDYNENASAWKKTVDLKRGIRNVR